MYLLQMYRNNYNLKLFIQCNLCLQYLYVVWIENPHFEKPVHEVTYLSFLMNISNKLKIISNQTHKTDIKNN